MQDNTQPFFTPGQGNDLVNDNRLEVENNLDTSNQAMNWQPSREKTPNQIGNTAINAPGISPESQNNPITPEVVTPNESPENTSADEPGQSVQNSTQAETKSDDAAVEEFHIESVGDTLDKATMQQVQKIENSKTVDFSKKYDEIAKLREEYYTKLMGESAT